MNIFKLSCTKTVFHNLYFVSVRANFQSYQKYTNNKLRIKKYHINTFSSFSSFSGSTTIPWRLSDYNNGILEDFTTKIQ